MSGPAIFITTPGDRRLARCAWPDAGFEQFDPFDIEPVYIVVPKNATDVAIARLSRRFGVLKRRLPRSVTSRGSTRT